MKICFVALQVYPFLSKKTSIETAGGAELQQMFIGEGLAAKGYDISYISFDYGQSDFEMINGLKIFKSFKPQNGFPLLRFFYPKLFKLWRALKKADADIYYIRSATYLPGIVVLFCKIHKKKIIFAGAHDTNFMLNNLRLHTRRDELLYKYGLVNADAIIVQSEDQKRLLKDNFNKEGKVIQNFYPYKSDILTSSQRKIILWVSTIKDWKRPEQFLRLAQKFPSEQFFMIGGKPSAGGQKLYDDIVSKASRLENVHFLGFQPFEITEKYFDQCKIFINTSQYEGFPNTFLQAWNRGIPVISYVDPDNTIQKNRLGFVVKSETDLEEALSNFLKTEDWNYQAIWDYFNQNHSSGVIEQYHKMFSGLMDK